MHIFTFSNVSKHNYAFSDFPFPDETIDYVHHSEMADYIKRYVDHFEIKKNIQFHIQVNGLEKSGKSNS